MTNNNFEISWYLCQISLQIMLLPKHITHDLEGFSPHLGAWPMLGNETLIMQCLT